MQTTSVATTTTGVLIVGAGPSGLATALTLAQAGIPVTVLERQVAPHTTSRAAVLHAHTLDVLDRLGVAGSLRRLGLTLDEFTIRDRGRVLLRLGFRQLPSPNAGLLMLPQNQTEQVLLQALAAAGVTVQRGWSVERIADEGGRVTVLAAGDGQTRRFAADYVIGADGMDSHVRRTAGIGFPGRTFAQSFVLADVHLDWPYGRQDVKLFTAPAGLLVVAPLPDGSFRLVATADAAPEVPDLPFLNALLAGRGPTDEPGRVGDIVWGSRFRLHHRVADEYRRGRLLLVGDAAHVHSPAGGQGMNTGLVDAWVLGTVLAAVVSGRQPESYLDNYARLRRPAAQHVLGMVGRLTTLATLRAGPLRALRNTLFRSINAVPMARHQLVLQLSGLAREGAARLPTAGAPRPAAAGWPSRASRTGSRVPPPGGLA